MGYNITKLLKSITPFQCSEFIYCNTEEDFSYNINFWYILNSNTLSIPNKYKGIIIEEINQKEKLDKKLFEENYKTNINNFFKCVDENENKKLFEEKFKNNINNFFKCVDENEKEDSYIYYFSINAKKLGKALFTINSFLCYLKKIK